MSANISDAIDTFNRVIAKLASIGLLLMTLITFAIVVLRYGFDTGWIALQESVMYLHALVFMLGAAYTLREDGHVRVDIFYRKFSLRVQAFINIFGTLLLLFPVCIFILVISWDYVSNSWRLLEASKEAGGLPLVFVLKSLIPAFSVLMLLQGLADILRNIVLIRKVGSM
ncbi:TRAP transporter small permease subunit [Alteromonas sp. ASW11-36]|uniref:TRAP transporter small permease protein n=1 Tax=Alteromonas arenosi TaxID=3055817 RepID=A0ABT7SZ69_9ALTE|nr:TRAP transporter small permease subunit [Alteromonas sp. ASW11-36]MDM7861488.1 TRAP transporter small permease subunit [Alteromonas sp. ASW11-36]